MIKWRRKFYYQIYQNFPFELVKERGWEGGTVEQLKEWFKCRLNLFPYMPFNNNPDFKPPYTLIRISEDKCIVKIDMYPNHPEKGGRVYRKYVFDKVCSS